MQSQLSTNVKRSEEFQQVCVWPGTIITEDQIEEFEEWILEEFGTRVKYLETIYTAPDRDKNGNIVKDTGGRADVLFAVHVDDVNKFAVPRLSLGIRWIEDAVSQANGYFDNPIYPERVLNYKTWNLDDELTE